MEERGRLKRLALGVGAGFGSAFAVAGAAQAQDFTVTDLGDSGAGTLRDAVEQANAQPGADRVLFQSGLSGTIGLESVIEITDPVSVDGPGADSLAVSGGGVTRIFAIDAPGPVALSGLTLRDAYEFGGFYAPGYGGAVVSTGTELTITGTRFADNRAGIGSAVHVDGGELAMAASTLTGNEAQLGGAVSVADGSATISGSTFSRNRAGQFGGAVLGLYLEGETSLEIENSTIARNVAALMGGGVAAFGPTPEGDGALPIDLSLRSSTITGNQALGGGGGVSGGFRQATVENSILADNFSLYGPDLYSGSFFYGPPSLLSGDPHVAAEDCGCYVTTFDTSFSLITDPAGAQIQETVPGSNITGQDPLLGQLGDNGGPTETVPLSPQSPAVNKGSSPLGADQRGSTRPVEYPGVPNSPAPGADGADMGAFELQAPVAPPQPPPPQPPTPTPPASEGVFKLSRAKLNKKAGTATVRVTIPSPGKVTLLGRKGLIGSSRQFSAAGVYPFRIKARGQKARSLARRGRAQVLAKFRYVPDSGRTVAKGRTVVLRMWPKKPPKRR